MKSIDPNKKIQFTERSDCILHKKSNLALFRIFKEARSRSKILQAVAISINNTIICDDFVDSLLLKKEFENFNYPDDSGNKFLKFVHRKIDGKLTKRFKIIIDSKTFYYSKQESEAIISAWNTALLGSSQIILAENHSFKKIIESCIETPLDPT